MPYTKGDILTYHFPKRTVKKIKKSNVITQYHRVVVLHSRETPHKTVLIAPITSASSLISDDNIPSNYVRLQKEKYPMVLDNDSFINLDMCVPVDEYELSKLERYNKRIDCCLTNIDMNTMNLKIILTYELSKFIDNRLNEQLRQEFENVITFIDENIKTRIVNLMQKVDDTDVAKDILNIIDYLITELKDAYIDNN